MAGRKPLDTSMPSIIATARSRVEKKLLMGGPTYKELMEYVAWATKVAHLQPQEAQILTLDKAIGDFLRRDVAWQAHRQAEGKAVAAPPQTAVHERVQIPRPPVPNVVASGAAPAPSAPNKVNPPPLGGAA